VSSFGQTPLERALVSGSVDVVRGAYDRNELIRFSTQNSGLTGGDRYNALHVAVASGRSGVIEFLEEECRDLRCKNTKKRLSLLAVANKHEQLEAACAQARKLFNSFTLTFTPVQKSCFVRMVSSYLRGSAEWPLWNEELELAEELDLQDEQNVENDVFIAWILSCGINPKKIVIERSDCGVKRVEQYLVYGLNDPYTVLSREDKASVCQKVRGCLRDNLSAGSRRAFDKLAKSRERLDALCPIGMDEGSVVVNDVDMLLDGEARKCSDLGLPEIDDTFFRIEACDQSRSGSPDFPSSASEGGQLSLVPTPSPNGQTGGGRSATEDRRPIRKRKR